MSCPYFHKGKFFSKIPDHCTLEYDLLKKYNKCYTYSSDSTPYYHYCKQGYGSKPEKCFIYIKRKEGEDIFNAYLVEEEERFIEENNRRKGLGFFGRQREDLEEYICKHQSKSPEKLLSYLYRVQGCRPNKINFTNTETRAIIQLLKEYGYTIEDIVNELNNI